MVIRFTLHKLILFCITLELFKKDYMTFDEKKKVINHVFQELRGMGIASKYSVNKPWKFLENESNENAVTYQKSDFELLEEKNYIILYWKGDGDAIYNQLKKYFYKVVWDRMVGSTIKVCFC